MTSNALKDEATSGVITNDVRLLHLLLMMIHDVEWSTIDYSAIRLQETHLLEEVSRYIKSKNDPVWDGSIERKFCEKLTELTTAVGWFDLGSYCLDVRDFVTEVRNRLTQTDRRNLDILQARFLSRRQLRIPRK